MPEFYVEQRQTAAQGWTVEATSKADAIRRVRNGEGEALSFEITSTGGYWAEPTDREVGSRKGV